MTFSIYTFFLRLARSALASAAARRAVGSRAGSGTGAGAAATGSGAADASGADGAMGAPSSGGACERDALSADSVNGIMLYFLPVVQILHRQTVAVATRGGLRSAPERCVRQ